MENSEKYQNYKNKLKEVYTKLVTEKSYLLELETCTERGFYDILMELEDAWWNLATADSLIFDEKSLEKEKNSFKYRIYEWTDWMHNFNQRLLYTLLNLGQKPAKPFDVPAFIEYLVRQTGLFLDAGTKEEELKVLNRRPYIITNSNYLPPRFEEQIWLTSEDVGVESENLPYYFPMDVSEYMSFEDLKQKYTKGKKEEEWSEFTKICVASWKQFWTVVDAAKKKGLIKDKEDR